MPTEENKKIAHRIREEIVNQGKMEVADELIADNYVWHGPGGLTANGPEGFKNVISGFRSAFPDLKIIVNEELAEGDFVVFHYTTTGTHKGEFSGIPPTGKQVKFSGIILRRIVDGKLLEDWDMYDSPTFMKQLGVAP